MTHLSTDTGLAGTQHSNERVVVVTGGALLTGGPRTRRRSC